MGDGDPRTPYAADEDEEEEEEEEGDDDDHDVDDMYDTDEDEDEVVRGGGELQAAISWRQACSTPTTRSGRASRKMSTHRRTSLNRGDTAAWVD
jgi:hypothetical protein